MECLLQMKNEVGERPTWCHVEQALYWVDIPACKLHRYIPSKKEHTTISLESSISAVNKRQNGGFICAGKDGFFFYGWEKNSYRFMIRKKIRHKIDSTMENETGKEGSGQGPFMKLIGTKIVELSTALIQI